MTKKWAAFLLTGAILLGMVGMTTPAAADGQSNPAASTQQSAPRLQLGNAVFSEVSNSGFGTVLMWHVVEGATGYRIYRDGNLLTTVTDDLSYVDYMRKDGEKHTYSIEAIAVENGVVVAGNRSAAVTNIFLRPVNVKSAKLTANKKVMVTYSRNAKAQGYLITLDSGKHAKKVTVKGNRKLKKEVSKLQEDQTYYVSVQAFIKSGGFTYYSAPVSSRTVRIKGSTKISTKTLTLEPDTSKKLSMRNYKGKVTWSSSNSKVAKVSSKGLVIWKKEGKATIKAQAGGKTYSCKVTCSKVFNDGKLHLSGYLANDSKSTDSFSVVKVMLTNRSNKNITVKGNFGFYIMKSGMPRHSGPVWPSYHLYKDYSAMIDRAFGAAKINLMNQQEKENRGEDIVIKPGETKMVFISLKDSSYIVSTSTASLNIHVDGESQAFHNVFFHLDGRVVIMD